MSVSTAKEYERYNRPEVKNKMGIFKSLSNNVVEIGVMAVTIVLVSILLNNLKDTSGVTSALNTSIDTAVTGIGTPITYIGIVILVLIFAAILSTLVAKMKSRESN